MLNLEVPDAAGRMRQRLEQLAAGTGLQPVFEVLKATEAGELRRLVDVEWDLLIAPTVLRDFPLLAELARRQRQVLLVEVEEQSK